MAIEAKQIDLRSLKTIQGPTIAELYLTAHPDLTTGDTVKDATCEDDYSAGVRTWTFDDKSALVFETTDITVRKGRE